MESCGFQVPTAHTKGHHTNSKKTGKFRIYIPTLVSTIHTKGNVQRPVAKRKQSYQDGILRNIPLIQKKAGKEEQRTKKCAA